MRTLRQLSLSRIFFKSRTATDSEIVRIFETILENRRRKHTLTYPLFWLLTLSLHTFSAYKSTVLKMSRRSESVSFKTSLTRFYIWCVEIASVQGHIVKDKLSPTLLMFVKDESSVMRLKSVFQTNTRGNIFESIISR